MKKNFRFDFGSLISTFAVLSVFVLSSFFIADSVSAQVSEKESASPSAVFQANAASLGAIPDGGSGPRAYGSPLDVTFTVSGLSGSVSNVSVSFSASHTYVGDLDVVLKSPGGTVSHVIFSSTGSVTATSGGLGADLSSANTYTFNDAATTNWWSAVTTAGSGAVPTGSYRTTATGGTGQTNPAPVTSMNAAFASVTNPNGTWTLSFRDGWQSDTGTVTAASLTIDTATVASKPCFDFYGSGRTSFATVNTEGTVRVWRTRNNGGTGSENYGYGLSADTLTPGYYDGDNKTDISVWRSGTYYYRPSTSSATNPIVPVPWGLATDTPTLEADYDGDGKDDMTVLRLNGTSVTWYILRSGSNTFTATPFGNFYGSTANNNDAFMAGADYNGDGKADLSVVRVNPSGGETYYIGDSLTGNLILTQQWGEYATDFYVVGDFLGDSKADFAVWRGYGSAGTGTWYIKENGGNGQVTTTFGIPGTTSSTDTKDKAICGDYNGDGKSDIAIYRPTNKTFYWLTNPANAGSGGQYTMTFTPDTAAFTGEIAVGQLRTY